MKIVFMGTPDFAVPPLSALIENGYDLAAVFTQPDKPKGRGYTLCPPPVKECALKHGIKVFQNPTMRDGEAEKIIKDISPDLIVVVAYGKILPKEILSIPKFGCVNVHASVLPKYRGASPIQWAIVNGEKETGVTTMYMNEGMDTGDILKIAVTNIKNDETSVELGDRLCELGAELLIKTLAELEKGQLTPQKQDDSLATYAPIIKKEFGLINWNDSADKIHNQIRGLQPWPAAFTHIDGKMLKVYKSSVKGKTNYMPGTVAENKEALSVACGDGNILEIYELQLEGKSRMSAADMLRGKNIEIGTALK